MVTKTSDIFSTLHRLGIGRTYLGAASMVEVLTEVIKNEDLASDLPNKLYPDVASHNNITVEKMQRNFRTLVTVCWKDDHTRAYLIELADRPLKDKPSVAEFIDIVATALRKKGA